jgi:hypothetical protein
MGAIVSKSAIPAPSGLFCRRKCINRMPACGACRGLIFLVQANKWLKGRNKK